MKEIICSRCGSNKLDTVNGYAVCAYCGTKFQITNEDLPNRQSNISINDDIERLLEKCRKEPKNAKRYANLILDIDPTNLEAAKYL